MDAHAPVCILNVIINWYSKLNGTLKWKGILSEGFTIKSGVMAGSILSPLLFVLYINDLIECLKEGARSYMGVNYCGCLLFADDILLISISVLQLQRMLTNCYEYCKARDLKFNVNKYKLMVVRQGDKETMPSMLLGAETLSWVAEMKYLGVSMYSKHGL